MVAMAVALTANTKLAPQGYERQLLDQNAVNEMTEPALQAMLLQARTYNA